MKPMLGEKGKQLLRIEYLILGSCSCLVVALLSVIFSSIVYPIVALLSLIIALYGFIIIIYCRAKLEIMTGYYKCPKCKHKFVPSLKTYLCSMHFGIKKYFKCPECEKKSWMNKDFEEDE